MTQQVIDNIAWCSLTGPHARFSAGANEARRYSPGFASIIAFSDLERPDFAALNSCCEPGEQFYCSGWSGIVPSGWQIDSETTMYKMIWDAPMPVVDKALDAVQLGSGHVSQMLELVRITHPGPFGQRTVELGEYYGFLQGEHLIAMAGERMYAGVFREISGVCTHPEFQGQGLARRLVQKLIRREIQRKEIPFLHVLRDTGDTHHIYERIGFRHNNEVILRIISRKL
jgi:ribosomal protein S18 acetylase RimI-like enzyme